MKMHKRQLKASNSAFSVTLFVSFLGPSLWYIICFVFFKILSLLPPQKGYFANLQHHSKDIDHPTYFSEKIFQEKQIYVKMALPQPIQSISLIFPV